MHSSIFAKPNPTAAHFSPERLAHLRLLGATLIIAIPPIIVLLLPAFGQPVAYHAFADQRTWHGIPHACDVLTNLPFLFAGLFGLYATRQSPATTLRAAWLAFFGGVTLVALGSGWYHLAPTNASLIWDRLPMTFAFTALFSAVLGETVSGQLGRRALFPLLLLGTLSVLWWQRYDDLRPYFAIQALSLGGVPALLAFFPRRNAGRGWLIAGLGGYALAIVAEQSDAIIFALTSGVISGHSLKHFIAASACTLVAIQLRAHHRLHPAAVR
ncbi:MAG: hypothetical protein HZA31_02450 [Opitutae bacterium]|nr:hypothetical protein [Opitutae bacterium]